MSSPTEEIKNILSKKSPEPEALRLIPEALARQYLAVPLAIEGNILRVAMANPSDILALVRLYKSSTIKKEMVFDFCNDRDEIIRLTGERSDTKTAENQAELTPQFN